MDLIGALASVNKVTDVSTPWELTNATYVQSFSVGTQDPTPEGLFFGDSGTKMYVVGPTNDRVYQYTLSTAWDISSASYASKSFLVTGGGEIRPKAMSFKPDGTKMYIYGEWTDKVHEFDLSTAWDVTSASYLQVSGALRDSSPEGMFFKPDGTKVYLSGGGNDRVDEFDLSPAWDITTATYNGITKSVSSQTTGPRGVFFKDDGTKMYVMDENTGVYEYDVVTPWNVSTASYVQSFNHASQDNQMQDIFFKDDGTKMYLVGNTNTSVYEYSL